MKKNTSNNSGFFRILGLAGMLLGLIVASPMTAIADEGEVAAAEYTGMAPQICLNCHGETSARPAHEMLQTTMARKADPNSPFGGENHSCETCHGPSKAHVMAQGQEPPGFRFDDSSTTEQKNAKCLSCHEDEGRFHWPGSTHKLEGVACVDCHNVHKPDDPVLSVETQPEVCFGCHKEQRAQFLRQSHHPVQVSSNAYSHTGMLACTDCHNTHGKDGPSNLKRNTVNETCYHCHAEKRGPFLWEHQPAREDCTNCHRAHGSPNDPLLEVAQPFLCMQCHAGHHGPQSDMGTLGSTEMKQAFFSRCTDCHTSIHGTDIPSAHGRGSFISR